MKAMIFAAGLGTRLKPFTDTKPKALFSVCGKPLLEHVIRKLIVSGFDEIIVNVHHFPEQIIDFLRQNKNFGIRIEISDEREALLDTGGGIKKSRNFFDDGNPFLVHNADILSDVDPAEFYRFHLQQDHALATLLVSNRTSSRYLLWDSLNKLAGWINIQTGELKSPFDDFIPDHYTRRAFGGIHVLSPAVFHYMDADDWPEKFPIIDFYLSVADRTNIFAYMPPDLHLVDVGKPENLSAAEELIRKSKK
ncbi:MAG: nucleotidyltransferase family protein [Candidatus Azobacteroides sp.]|nr:nucleotidyltransferase family protein [Candidatus Azobacteroides sp.]